MRRRYSIVLALVLSLVLAACGNADSPTTTEVPTTISPWTTATFASPQTTTTAAAPEVTTATPTNAAVAELTLLLSVVFDQGPLGFLTTDLSITWDGPENITVVETVTAENIDSLATEIAEGTHKLYSSILHGDSTRPLLLLTAHQLPLLSDEEIQVRIQSQKTWLQSNFGTKLLLMVGKERISERPLDVGDTVLRFTLTASPAETYALDGTDGTIVAYATVSPEGVVKYVSVLYDFAPNMMRLYFTSKNPR